LVLSEVLGIGDIEDLLAGTSGIRETHRNREASWAAKGTGLVINPEATPTIARIVRAGGCAGFGITTRATCMTGATSITTCRAAMVSVIAFGSVTYRTR
jgi:hypothetical protein